MSFMDIGPRGADSEGWLDRYACRVVELKTGRSILDSTCRAAISKAFKTIYRAVAFDIDGTLTSPEEVAIDPGMAKIVRDLLLRSVPVILVTGRGDTGIVAAGSEIHAGSQVNMHYLRRLYALGNNGTLFLSTPDRDPLEIFGERNSLGPELQNMDRLRQRLEEKARKVVGGTSYAVREKGRSFRIELDNEELREKVITSLESDAKKLSELAGVQLRVFRGRYGQKFNIDVAAFDKNEGLGLVASTLGISAEEILRIGDQGSEGGNDFDVLRSTSGFSVGAYCGELEVCHPVLRPGLAGQPLTGAAATKQLLTEVLLFPQLSLDPETFAQRIDSLRLFEGKAIGRSRREDDTLQERLAVRLRYLVPDLGHPGGELRALAADLYDPLSGAIRMREWELLQLPDQHPARFLFTLPDQQRWKDEAPRSSWSMFSDTGLLLRGPMYYYGLLEEDPLGSWAEADVVGPNGASEETPRTRSVQGLRHFLGHCMKFLWDARLTVKVLRQENADPLRFKVVLGILDNVRNILLQALHAAYVIDGHAATPRVVRIFVLLVRHMEFHYRFHFHPDADWRMCLAQYASLIRGVGRAAADLLRAAEFIPSLNEEVLKWRECDSFLQNVSAVQIGLHELRQRNLLSDNRLRPNAFVGIASGGIELPAIASMLCRARDLPRAVTAMAAVSIYGSDSKIPQGVRSGSDEYLRSVSKFQQNLCIFDLARKSLSDLPVVIMDDNCTTCRTLQFTRDFLVYSGADVVGAIVVRFPSANRAEQMAMPGHGFPDPEVLFAFVRGLVAPSPYARLLTLGPDQSSKSRRYLDSTDVFDKSKDRIKRYLKKNNPRAAG